MKILFTSDEKKKQRLVDIISGQPGILKSQLWTATQMSGKLLRNLIDELEAEGLIICEYNGKGYHYYATQATQRAAGKPAEIEVEV